jgi:hypothetical protein
MPKPWIVDDELWKSIEPLIPVVPHRTRNDRCHPNPAACPRDSTRARQARHPNSVLDDLACEMIRQ